MADFDSSSSMPGFYINISGNNSNHLNVVRITFFTHNPEETKKITETFLKNNSNIVSLPVEDFGDEGFKEPRECKISEGYGGEEIRFRNFLNTHTHIRLDLLDYDILYSKRVVAEYRLTYSTQKISPKPLFEPTFAKHSKFFLQLDSGSIEQLWKDLIFWHPIRIPGCVADWTHFLVNMLLPGDWIYMQNRLTGELLFKDFFLNPSPRQPITGKERIEMLKIFSLEDFHL